MDCFHDMDLDSYKYVELQRLSKEVGLKANMKVNRVSKVKHDPRGPRA